MHRSPIVVFVLLSLAACSVNQEYSDPRRVSRAETQFKARDACLKQNVVAFVNTADDPATVAHAVSEICRPETAKLIEISNPSGDPEVAEAIRKDTKFRAAGYVMRARGAPSTN